MIWIIALKEFKNNLLTPRFTVSLLLCLLLFPYSIYTGTRVFESRMDKYERDLVDAKQQLEKTQVYGQLTPILLQKPIPLSIFSTGISEQVGSRVTIHIHERPAMAEGVVQMHQNPFMAAFQSLDFVSILTIVLSLIAILFSYDLFSSEKETGTLKLALSNAVGRHQFFAGKIAGIFLTLLPILLISGIASAVILLLSPVVSLSLNDVVRLGLVFLLSLLYFSFFVFLGAFVSSKVKYASSGVIINLFAWALLVFLLPSVMSYVGKNVVKVGHYGTAKNNIEDIEKQFWKRHEAISNQVSEEGLQRQGWNICSGWNYGPLQIYFTPKPTMEYERRMHELTAPSVLEFTDKKWAIQENHLQYFQRQERVIKYLQCISPAGLMKHITANLCKSDITNHWHFMDQCRVYHTNYFNYLKDAGIFSSFKYFTAQPESEFPENWEEAQTNYTYWRKTANPESTFDLSSFGYLDTSDIPSFEYQEFSILENLKQQAFFIAGLLLVCVLLFWGTHISFLNYDIR